MISRITCPNHTCSVGHQSNPNNHTLSLCSHISWSLLARSVIACTLLSPCNHWDCIDRHLHSTAALISFQSCRQFSLPCSISRRSSISNSICSLPSLTDSSFSWLLLDPYACSSFRSPLSSPSLHILTCRLATLNQWISFVKSPTSLHSSSTLGSNHRSLEFMCTTSCCNLAMDSETRTCLWWRFFVGWSNSIVSVSTCKCSRFVRSIIYTF